MKETPMNDKVPADNYQIPSQLLQQLALNQAQQPQDDEIDLAELWRAIWAGKWLIIAVTTIFAIASVAYALSLPNIYKSEALLAPATQEKGSMGGLASKFGGLASLAGVSLGGGQVDNTGLAIEIMKSRVFVEGFLEEHKLLVLLMAIEGWNHEDNELIYDADAYDAAAKKWIRNVKAPFKPKPSSQEAYEEFMDRISINQNSENSMISISVKHYSPEIAKQWVDWLIDAINIEMKSRDLTEAKRSIDYLKHQLSQTKVSAMQDVLYEIIEEQTKTIMFAEIRDEYAFKTIDPAVIPELHIEPRRVFISIAGGLLAFIFSILFVLIRDFLAAKTT